MRAPSSYIRPRSGLVFQPSRQCRGLGSNVTFTLYDSRSAAKTGTLVLANWQTDRQGKADPA